MNTFRIAVLMLLMALPQLVQAQKVKLADATHHSWSGGIAGRHGDNYVFTIAFTRFTEEPVPDTLWIGKKVVVLNIADAHGKGMTNPHQNANTTVSRSKGKITYTINAQLAYDDHDLYPHPPGDEQPKPKDAAPRVPYTGLALLSYRYGSTMRTYTIAKVLKEYPPANYP